MTDKKINGQPLDTPDSWIDQLSHDELMRLTQRLVAKLDAAQRQRRRLVGLLQHQIASFNLTLGELAHASKAVTIVDRSPPPRKGKCPICKFATQPPHDGRKHSSQGKTKRAFSKNELKLLRLTRV